MLQAKQDFFDCIKGGYGIEQVERFFFHIPPPVRARAPEYIEYFHRAISNRGCLETKRRERGKGGGREGEKGKGGG